MMIWCTLGEYEGASFYIILHLMKLWAVLFLIIPIFGVFYVLWHVWNILPLPVTVKVIVVTLLAMALACLFYNFIVGLDDIPLWVARSIYETGTSSLFVLLYAVMLFLVLDVLRITGILPLSFLYSSVAGSVFVIVFLCIVFALGNVNYQQKIRRNISLRAATPLKRPLKLVMMSDIHLGYHITRNELAHWVDLVNKEKPDAVLIAGDVIDISVVPVEKENMAAEMRRIKVPVYVCPGNHEYYSGIDKAEKFFREAEMILLRDSCAVIGGELTVIGRDDRTNLSRKSVAELVRKAPKTKYTVLLDHQPYHLGRTAKAGVDFQFSGHTHYGQVWPVSWIENIIYENAFGAKTIGRTHFYVSSGIGIWGGKFRIGTCSEYVVAEVW